MNTRLLHRILSLALGALLLSAAIAAAVPLVPRAASGSDLLGSGRDFTAILYDSSNGLPTSEANAIAQSGDGFLWIGGYSGLTRYDGTSFHRFDASSGISSVFSLYVDSKDRIWIGTNENGIAVYDHGDIRVYGRTEGLKSYSIRSIAEDAEGNLLIATTQGLAYVGAGDLQVHVIDDPQVNMEYIMELSRAADGRIFGLTLDGAVFEVSGLRIASFYHPEEFGESPVNCLCPDPADPAVLLMGTAESEILTVEVSERLRVLRRRSVAPQKSINAIHRAGETTWIASNNGIGCLTSGGRYLALEDLPMDSSVGHIMEDHEGNLWFTSTRQGVMKLVPDRFTDVSRMAGLEPMVVNSTCLRGNLLYIGADTGLTVLDRTSYRKIDCEIAKLLEGIRIRCIKQDSRGNLWFCTHGEHGLVCLSPDGHIEEYNEEDGLTANRVRAITECRDGSMAVATGNGLFLVREGAVQAHYGQENGISTTEILSVEEGPDGRLYLGSDGDGIYCVDGNRVSRIGYEDGLTSEVVMRIKWDADRELFWLITSNSIQYWREGKIVAVDRFPYSNNLDIIFSEKGAAWILSSNGIYVTRADDLIANERIEYSFYNTKSGLPCITTGNSRSCVDEEGHLYISGTTGVCMVDINAEEGNDSAVLLAIPSVELDDRTVSLREGDAVAIPAGCRRLTVNAYALTYGLSNPRLTYFLEGFDEAPIHTTKQEMQPVTYTNLDGGSYVFHLNVINDETGEVEKSLSLPVTKERSPYESILFWIVLMAVAVGGISLLIYRHFQRETARLRAKEEADQRFIDQIIHTLAKCIDMRDSQNRGHSFRVAYYTRLLAEKLSERRGYTKEQINEFHNIALLHDIGKLSIPDSILNKPERLNDEEYAVMKSHAAKGAEILKDVNIVRDLAVGAGCHHERMDGKGYPRGLKGEEIPEVARIIAVADTFDAMYSTRPYRKQLDLSVVLAEIRRIRGSQLEEEVVDALLSLAEEGALEKAKVDATVERAPQLVKEARPAYGEASAPTGRGDGDPERSQADDAFLKDLGLHVKQRDGDTADKQERE